MSDLTTASEGIKKAEEKPARSVGPAEHGLHLSAGLQAAGRSASPSQGPSPDGAED